MEGNVSVYRRLQLGELINSVARFSGSAHLRGVEIQSFSCIGEL